MIKFRLFLLSFCFFASVAFVAPYMVLYYQSLGFSGAEIGALTGISPLITLVSTPFWTGLADATRRHRLIMSMAVLSGVVIMFTIPLLRFFLPLLFLGWVYSTFSAPLPSLTDSATMHMLGDEKDKYGRVRLGGTIGYGLVAPFAGLVVQNYGLRWAFWGCAIFLLVFFLLSQKLTFGLSRAQVSFIAGLRVLLTDHRWRIFLLLAFASGLSVTVTNIYLFPYLKSLGTSETWMGISLTLGTISEIPVLFFGNRLLKRFKPFGLFILGLVLSGLRLVLFAACATPAPALVLQFFNGVTFPLIMMAGVAYAYEHAPAGMGATAQGIFGATTWGFGSAVAGFAGGLALEGLGARGLYLVFGLVVLLLTAFGALAGQRRN